MRESEYRSFYDWVGAVNGWDFSSVRCRSEGAAWDFYREVADRCRKTDVLLDIGTGGGEKLLGLAGYARQLIGIDQSAGMIETARANAAHAGITNVSMLQMAAEKLELPDACVHVIACRHAPFDAHEAFRVLSAGGQFLTQQVGERDKHNLAEAFGRGQHTAPDGTLMRRYLAELSDAGFRDVQASEYDAEEYYERPEDLVFLLKHTPIIPHFGERDGDFAILERFIADNRTPIGIRTNAKRFMITASK
ncbi:class I SAM-dependent methyltransferase [Paenibacillus sp. R14(2021)]|uniref:class I SAM-dependent methyltransferase n=1 Tax=Paenibacillus sp. R14(2021) TaxID=2859228 RepID=UPI001C611FF7|nr:class I SAM-dependent methyltransferase [Paenibacillus sp. R14(2021)]